MKRIGLFVMLIALFALSATAIQVGSPTIGAEKQDRIVNVTSTFTITNNATTTMTNIGVVATADTKYSIVVSGVPASIGPGASASVTITGTIPLSHPGVDAASLEEKALKIGTLTVTGTTSASESATVDINMQAVNQFRIKKARIECSTKSQSLDDGDRIENLKPGDDCTLEIEVENEFDDTDTDNKKIGDIAFDSVDISVDSSDSDIDVNEDDSIDDLDASDEDSMTVDLEIDDEADDGTISVEIRATARDENGALHGEMIDFRLEVDRLTHDVQIRRIELSPTSTDNCLAVNAKVNVNLLNQGKRDEDEAAVEVNVPDLKFTKKVGDVQLDKDDSTSVSFDVPVAKDTKPGVYRVDVRSYFDNVAPSNSGSAELTVIECEEEVAEVVEQPKTSTTVVVPQTPPQGQTQAQAAPKRDTTSGFTESKAYVALLAVVIVLIVIGIVAMLVFLRKKQA